VKPIEALDQSFLPDGPRYFTIFYATLKSVPVFISGKQHSLSGRIWIMKRILIGLMSMVFAGAGSMMAQDGYYHHDRDVRRDYADRRSDFRDIRHDKAKIERDRHELRRDLYEHNFSGARYERRELGRDYRDLRQDHRDVYRDNRNIRHDQYGYDH
jgi:hypothetical protein